MSTCPFLSNMDVTNHLPDYGKPPQKCFKNFKGDFKWAFKPPDIDI